MSGHPSHRWDAFLNSVRERFIEIMNEAKEGCPQLLQESNLDPIPMGNAWSAIEMRAKQLETKISETWDGQVERAFEQANLPTAHERAKGEQLKDWIEVERERTRIAIYAEAGRTIFRHAAAEIARSFACVRCGAPLEVPFTFRALNVHCQHCRTVNGYEPGTRMRLAEICIHPLCEEAAWQQWLAMHQAEEAWRVARPVTIHHLKNWERAQIQFWHAYLTTRVRLLPDTAQAFDSDLRGRMRQFYESMERERPWIEAGRPRDLQ